MRGTICSRPLIAVLLAISTSSCALLKNRCPLHKVPMTQGSSRNWVMPGKDDPALRAEQRLFPYSANRGVSAEPLLRPGGYDSYSHLCDSSTVELIYVCPKCTEAKDAFQEITAEIVTRELREHQTKQDSNNTQNKPDAGGGQ